MQFLDNDIKNELLTEFGNYLIDKQPTLELWGTIALTNVDPDVYGTVVTDKLYNYDAEFRPRHVRSRWVDLFEDQELYPERFNLLHESWAILKSRAAANTHVDADCEVMMGYWKMGGDVFLPVADNKISLDISRLPAIPIDITARPYKLRFNFSPGEHLELSWGPHGTEEVSIGNVKTGEKITREEVVAFTDFSFTYA